LTKGFALSIGKDPKDVAIAEINGEAVRRRLSGTETEITFRIFAKNVEKLTMNIKEAASEGSIVRNIQQEASTNGVLTEGLKTMPAILPEPTIEEITVSEEVLYLEIVPTQAPTPVMTPAPTTAPTTAPTDGFSSASNLQISSVCLALAVYQIVMSNFV